MNKYISNKEEKIFYVNVYRILCAYKCNSHSRGPVYSYYKSNINIKQIKINVAVNLVIKCILCK